MNPRPDYIREIQDPKSAPDLPRGAQLPSAAAVEQALTPLAGVTVRVIVPALSKEARESAVGARSRELAAQVPVYGRIIHARPDLEKAAQTPADHFDEFDELADQATRHRGAAEELADKLLFLLGATDEDLNRLCDEVVAHYQQRLGGADLTANQKAALRTFFKAAMEGEQQQKVKEDKKAHKGQALKKKGERALSAIEEEKQRLRSREALLDMAKNEDRPAVAPKQKKPGPKRKPAIH